jgi:cysteine desulfurase / selenocysteine lyase
MAELMEDLLNNEDLRREIFPIAKSRIFFAHAAVAPIPAPVASAIASYAAAASRQAQFEDLHRAIETDARRLSAEMIGVEPDEIAFVPSTSAGLSMIANGLPWRPGDSVVIAESDFPANVYPWVHLRSRGVQVREAKRDPTGCIAVEDILSRVDGSTRLVALSSVHYCTGAAVPIEELQKELSERGVMLCLDAIQSLGAVSLALNCADFVVADGHKWLLGPQGFAVMSIRRRLFDTLFPVLLGWKSVMKYRDYVHLGLDLADSARRYEPGSLNVLGLVGLHAALSFVANVGTDRIHRRVLQIRSWLEEGLKERNYKILHARANSGIIAFRTRLPPEAVVRLLFSGGCDVSLRCHPEAEPCVRLSPHFYNTESEIAAFFGLLDRAEEDSSGEKFTSY